MGRGLAIERGQGVLAPFSRSNENYLVIYRPPGYDPNRAKPYPTLYLNHGGAENKMGWSTQGAMANILDNLINDGQIQPLIVVNPNAVGYPASANNAAFRLDLIINSIPYMEAHYNVSRSAAILAFSGLSMSGLLTNQFMLYNPDALGHYGMISAGFPPANGTLTPEQAAAYQPHSRGACCGAAQGCQVAVAARPRLSIATVPAARLPGAPRHASLRPACQE